MSPGETVWTGSLHQTFRLLPDPSRNLRPFLESDGRTEDEVLDALPYEPARARGRVATRPDARRYRDARQVYQTAGLLYEVDGKVRVTELGQTVLRWLDLLNEGNAPVLGGFAAYALAACQLRDPTRAGQRYDESVEVFPFLFIWRAMLALDDRISSEEMNRAMFKVTTEASLRDAIAVIRAAREEDDEEAMGDRVIEGDLRRNDRIIPWISIASFGWTLISDKDEHGGYYRIKPRARSVIVRAAALRPKHREFESTEQYVRFLSTMAGLPQEVQLAA